MREGGHLIPDDDVTETIVGPSKFVGPYEILSPLGAGGMGEVFRGRDPRLGRMVAIKFLSRATAADPAALERFRREAQAISALNHPNVCTIYDIGEQDRRPYLVMELLEGKTLKLCLASGRFSNDEILATAIPLLEALEAAHAVGIVHRDIKPANIFLTKLGAPKILDFGLAKTVGPGGDAAESLTVPGTTVGTAHYMAPEQVRGEAIDARADLFAFGVVLYEMATGTRPFEGANWADAIAAVISKNPRPPTEWNPKLNPEIARAIERALEKDPAKRYQSAADFRADLTRLRGAGGSAASLRGSSWRYAAVGAALAAVGGAGWYLWMMSKGPATVPSEFVQLTNFGDYATAPAISPDGKMIAFFRGGEYFLNSGQVYVKLLPDGESRQLTNDSYTKYNPVFTPDGTRIAYTMRVDQKWDTYTVPVLGGQPTRLIQNAAGLTWYGQGRIVFSEIMEGTALHMGIVTSTESRADERRIYFPAHERAMAHYAYPSPDQKSALIVEMDRQAAWQRCRLAPMDGSSMGVQVGPEGACIQAGWSPDGKWMYLNADTDGGTHLWRQRTPDTKPEQITFGPTEEEGLAVGPDGKYLITSIGIRRSTVWIHDSSGDHPLPVEGSVSYPKFSRDGKLLYYLLKKSNRNDTVELWSRELASGKSDAIVTGQHLSSFDISSDDSRVAYAVPADGTTEILVAPLNRGSAPRLITKDGDSPAFAADGTLLFRQLGPKASYLARIKEDGTGLERVLDHPIVEFRGASPDGEWAQPGGALDGTVGTYLFSLRDRTTLRVCGGPCIVRWANDGKSLFVISSELFASAGRTFLVPIVNGPSQMKLPANGFDNATDEELKGIQVIRHGKLSPGPGLDTFAYEVAAFEGNLFRVPLH